MHEHLPDLLHLARELGREDRELAILGEGNVSVKLDASRFAIKASGASLGKLTAEEVVICRAASLLSLLDEKRLSDEAVDQALLDSREDPAHRKPSVEAMFHAWLLQLEEIRWVAHCHPTTVNRVLCSPRARDFAERRLFPDEVVYCGAASVFVPYVDPGLPLAREIRDRTLAFREQQGSWPSLILLQNHGLIALGESLKAVLACVFMASKAAAIFTGAAALGGPVFLPPAQVERIARRGDEAFRKRQLEL
jgi:rhamnose utilization protein RhaD (predicted bifunctional aldolase and dehydrogenase)